MNTPLPLFAALAFELSPSVASGVTSAAPLHILPSGVFQSVDGRPASMKNSSVKSWRLNADDAARVIALAQRKRTKMVIDYEHQTLNAAKNGKKALAAGWVDPADLTFNPELGLCALKTDWTATAAAHIEKKEYRYLSPVFLFHPKTGAVTELKHLALTNDPGLDCLNEVAICAALTYGAGALDAGASLRLDPHLNPNLNPHPHLTPKEKPMEHLMAVLKLSPQASETAAVEAVAALQSQAANVDALQSEIVALKANQFDPVQHIPMAQHKAVADELAALTALNETNEHATLLTAALADSRIMPVNQAYWAAQPLVALKAFLVDAKPLVAALSGTQTGGKAPAAGTATVTLNDEELAVCKQLGLTPEAFLSSRDA